MLCSLREGVGGTNTACWMWQVVTTERGTKTSNIGGIIARHSLTRGVSHNVALPFTLKSIVRQKED